MMGPGPDTTARFSAVAHEKAQPIVAPGKAVLLYTSQERCQLEGQRAGAKQDLLRRLTAAGDVVFKARRREQVASNKWSRQGLAPERQAVQTDLDQLTEAKVELPWDILRGTSGADGNEFNVLIPARQEALALKTAVALVQHWAPQCSTFSLLRERPIPGVAKGRVPVPLRSAEHPKGLPELLGDDADQALKKNIEDDTTMAVFAATQCALAAATGRCFVLENPSGSHLWELPEVIALMAMDGVRAVLYHACAFGGVRRKAMTLLTNMSEVQDECGMVCGERRAKEACPYLGVPHLPWATVVDLRGTWKSPSKGEAEYQPRLCDALTKAFLRRRHAVVEAGGTLPPTFFIEVFSGPNAPLTAAVAAACKTVPRD